MSEAQVRSEKGEREGGSMVMERGKVEVSVTDGWE